MQKTILITGSTDGIGKQAALELARAGNHVIVHGRNQPKAEEAAIFIAGRVKSAKVDAVWADLSKPAQIDDMVAQLTQRVPELSVLVNNAGVFMSSFQQNERGHEMTWVVNHLATYCLSLKLLPLLSQNRPARIVNVASMVHAWSNLIPAQVHIFDHFTPQTAYNNSKLANVLFTYALARRLKKKEINVNCLHPGVIATKLLHAAWSGGSPLESGTLSILKLATDEQYADVTGKYMEDGKLTESSPKSRSVDLQEEIWLQSEQETGVYFKEIIDNLRR